MFEKSETCEIIHVQKNVMHFLSHCVLLRDLEFILSSSQSGSCTLIQKVGEKEIHVLKLT